MSYYTSKEDKFARYKSREAVIAFTIIIVVTILALVFCYELSFRTPRRQKGHSVPLPAEPKLLQPLSQPTNLPELEQYIIKTEPGDRLGDILLQHKIPAKQVAQLLELKKTVVPLQKLKPYHKMELYLDKADHRLVRMNYYFGELKALVIECDQQNTFTKVVKQKLEPHVHFASREIKHSFFKAATSAGLSEKLIYQLISNFSWEIDFNKDIRPGDQFAVIYNDYYLRDTKTMDGDILAALIKTRGRVFEIVRYTDSQGQTGFYTPSGKNVRTAFLRAPLQYRRISSPFNLYRLHPILHDVRPHRGVDYAAKWGTPIKATGDGKVIYRKRKGGYGKTIIIKHGGHYSTLYAHLSNYAKNLRVGSHVKQGQVIGFVGQTGMATGPHVHYEFRVDGEQVNPVKMRLPRAEPIDRNNRKLFLAKAKSLIAELKLYYDSSSSHQKEDVA